jgi:hypothetical protein
MVLQKTIRSKIDYKGSAAGRTVYAQMAIWRKGKDIHLTIPKEDFFHTTVNNSKGSIRCHNNLYKKLKKLLQQNNCWD